MREGDFVRLPDKTIWFVKSISHASARIVPVMSGKTKVIITRKKQTKRVADNPQPTNISVGSLVEILDPNSAFVLNAKRRFMSTAEATTETQAAETAETPRATQVYVRTEKAPKGEMRGQGKVVLDALNAMKEANVAQLTEACKGKFETKQDPARVVGFYLSKFKRDGLAIVKSAGEAAPAAEAGDAGQLEG